MLIAVLSLLALILGIGTLVGSTFVRIGPLANVIGTGKQRFVAILLLLIGISGFVSRSFVTIGADYILSLIHISEPTRL